MRRVLAAGQAKKRPSIAFASTPVSPGGFSLPIRTRSVQSLTSWARLQRTSASNACRAVMFPVLIGPSQERPAPPRYQRNRALAPAEAGRSNVDRDV